MRRHVRAGIAVALLTTSIFAMATLILNPRFVDDPRTGAVVFLLLPILAGSVLGPLAGRWLDRLAHAGSNENPARACELLWASLSGFIVFCGTFVFLPSFLGIFSDSETICYGGALVLAGMTGSLAIWTVRDVAHGFRLWVWPSLLALPLALIFAARTPLSGSTPPGSRMVVLAFPGLSWNVAEDLIEKGQMPNLAELRSSGAWGDLESVKGLPNVVWTSIATGKPHEIHGVSSFNAVSGDVQSRRLWEILEDRGWSVGLFGWPVTWPPRQVDGFIVPGISDPGWDTYPKDLRFIRDLAMREKTGQQRSWGIYCRFAFLGIRYGARLSTLMTAAEEIVLDPLQGRNLDAARLFDKRKLRAKLNCDYFVEVRRRTPVDFAAFHSNIVHVAQAHFWKYHEPERFAEISSEDVGRYGESVHDAYGIVDGFIGKVLASTGENDLVVVVSDHGAEALVDPDQRLTLRIEPMLTGLRLKGAVEATNVAARTYLHMKAGHEGNQERVQRLFETARLDRANVHAFEAHVDEWGNVEVRVLPEVASAMGDNLLFQGGRCPVREVIRPVALTESSKVQETGALVLNGHGVRPGREFEGKNLLDFVPTLLVLSGLELAADLPGDVISDALEPSLRDRVPGMVATYDVPPPAN